MFEKFARVLTLEIMSHLPQEVISLKDREDFMYELYEKLRNAPTMMERIYCRAANLGMTHVAIELATAYLNGPIVPEPTGGAEILAKKIVAYVEDVICVSTAKRDEVETFLTEMFECLPEFMADVEMFIQEKGLVKVAFAMWDICMEAMGYVSDDTDELDAEETTNTVEEQWAARFLTDVIIGEVSYERPDGRVVVVPIIIMLDVSY